MKYIPEYCMRSGVPVERFKNYPAIYQIETDAEGRIKGYPVYERPHEANGNRLRCYLIHGTAGASHGHHIGNCICTAIEVEPETVEPVRVKPILIDLQYHCPDDDCREKLHRWWDFCPSCGMALDWPRRI